MTAITIQSFAGEQPLVSPRLLPIINSARAMMAKLERGDLESWRTFGVIQSLPGIGPVNTIYPMDTASGVPKWLWFLPDQLADGAATVDVARGFIADDVSERTYFTGLGDSPCFTTLSGAFSGVTSESTHDHPPYTTYKLGVPAPTLAPTVAVELTTLSPLENTVNTVNGGAESGVSNWNVVTGDLNFLTGHAEEGLNYFYGGQAAQETLASQTYLLSDLGLGSYNKLSISSWHASGPNLSQGSAYIEFYTGGGALISGSHIGLPTAAGAYSGNPAPAWGNRSTFGQIPPTAASLKLFLQFTRVGSGINDHYIDNVVLTVERKQENVFDGTRPLTDFTGTGLDFAGLYMGGGNPAPSYHSVGGNNAHRSITSTAYNIRSTASFGVSFDYSYGNYKNWNYLAFYAGGVGFAFTRDGVYVNASTYGGGTKILPGPWQASNTNLPANAKFQFSRNGDSWDVICTMTQLANPTITQTGTTRIQLADDSIGWEWEEYTDGWLDNIFIKTTQPKNTIQDARDAVTNYVMTYVNDFGEESAPSPVSRSIEIGAGIQIDLTFDQVPVPIGWRIATRRLYRAAGIPAQYLFLVEIPVTDLVYKDIKEDLYLGEALASLDWDVPPADLKGLIPIANGIFAAFRNNELYFSVPKYPHAWPQVWVVHTDFPIVGLAAIDTDVYVLTTANAFLAAAADPSRVQLGKLEKPQGCTSKLSIATMDGSGVLYSTADGLAVISRGQYSVITEHLFTRDQWQSLSPANIRAIAHNRGYWFFSQAVLGSALTPGIAQRLSPAKKEVIRLNFAPTAQAVNTVTDELFFAIDGVLKVWEGGVDNFAYEWESKEFNLPMPMSFEMASVRTVGSGLLRVDWFKDGSDLPFYSSYPDSNSEFILPGVICEDSIRVKLVGDVRVRQISFSDNTEDLA